MGAAAMAYTIWTRHLRHNPRHPRWPDRDRFVLSGGHGSALLYSLLHLTGYDLSLDELKRFRQWGSLTPGHPEYDPHKDEKHWKRAVLRLDLSLQALSKLGWHAAVAMFHYPPRGRSADTELSAMVRAAGVKHVVYGHVHGGDAANAVEGDADGVFYRCVSADHVGFTPAPLLEMPG
jgi:predicted phosphohydrolase